MTRPSGCGRHPTLAVHNGRGMARSEQQFVASMAFGRRRRLRVQFTVDHPWGRLIGGLHSRRNLSRHKAWYFSPNRGRGKVYALTADSRGPSLWSFALARTRRAFSSSGWHRPAPVNARGAPGLPRLCKIVECVLNVRSRRRWQLSGSAQTHDEAEQTAVALHLPPGRQDTPARDLRPPRKAICLDNSLPFWPAATSDSR